MKVAFRLEIRLFQTSNRFQILNSNAEKSSLAKSSRKNFKLPFHVLRAASEDFSIANFAGEGRNGPIIFEDRHDVDVRIENDGFLRRRTAAPLHRNESTKTPSRRTHAEQSGVPIVIGFDLREFQPEFFSVFGEKFQCGRIIGFGLNRFDLNVLHEAFDRHIV